MSIFETNAVKLRGLHEEINTKFLRRNDGKTQWEAWQKAAATFHASWEQLAFPGGVNTLLPLLVKHDEQTIEMAVRFLEANPLYFRSGYLKADVIRHLKKAPLTKDQRRRLQEVVLARIRDKETPREFRRYGQLVPSISDPDFELKIANESVSSRSSGSRHARWILMQIESSRPAKSKPRKKS